MPDFDSSIVIDAGHTEAQKITEQHMATQTRMS